MRSDDVHPAQVAGLFYPAEAPGLRQLIAAAQSGAREDGGVAPKVVIAPHAGLVYSGAVAATAFGPWTRRVEAPKRIVIVGPAHRHGFRGLAIHPAARWATPLGEARVAADAAAKLAGLPAVAVDARPFVSEHSLEMHLVMLQAMLPGPFEIAPILVGDAEPAEVAAALSAVWGGPETVVSLSSDLSHFHDQKTAVEIDAETARRIEIFDAAAVNGARACGFKPICGALAIADQRDMRISALHLATSADVGADPNRVVGYGAFSFEYSASARLAESDRQKLLAAAMATLSIAARSGGRPPRVGLEARTSPALTAMRATFVTLTRAGELRGCVGSVAPRRPLVEDVVMNAVRAGFGDPRFPGLSEGDLAGLEVDVSILSHLRPLAAGSEAELAAALEPDRDGLVLGAGGRQALFLPSVWEKIASPTDFIRHLLAKAGLDPRRWPEGAQAWRFRVEAFGAPWRDAAPGEYAPIRIEAGALN